MTKTAQNFTMYRNDSKTIKIAVVDKNEDPKNLSGASALWILKNDAQRAQVTKRSGGNGITFVDINGTSDGIQIALASTDTSGLNDGIYYHQADVTDSEGNRATVATGKITICC